MLVLGIAGLVAGVVLGIVASHQHGGAAVALVVVCAAIIATKGLDGLQPARGVVQRAGHPADRQHQHLVPVTMLPMMTRAEPP
jgi:hypothetical protein